jgi:hypothetical protein
VKWSTAARAERRAVHDTRSDVTDPHLTVEIASQVLMVGDSTAQAFDNRVVLRAGAPMLAFRAFYVEGARVSKMGSKLNMLTPSLIEDALISAQFIIDDGAVRTATHRIAAPAAQWEGVNRRWTSLNALNNRREPLLVLSYGSFDILDLADEFAADDLELSPAALARWPTASYSREPLRADAMGWETARHTLWWHVRSLGSAIVRLRAAGFARIALLSVKPPNPDDDGFTALARTSGVTLAPARRRAALRYKLAVMLNEVLAWTCATEDAEFFDTWPLLVEDGVLRREFMHADQFHLSESAILRIIGLIAESGIDPSEPPSTAPGTGSSQGDFAPGDWVVHEAIYGPALVVGAHRDGTSLVVHRPAHGLRDVWNASRVRLATPDEVAQARAQ